LQNEFIHSKLECVSEKNVMSLHQSACKLYSRLAKKDAKTFNVSLRNSEMSGADLS